jgi:ABC-type phosphate/phosphonate transport system substrate-binding protein
MTTNILPERLIEKVQKLSPEQIKKVENFIETLSKEKEDKELTSAYTKLSEISFSKVWDNPEDADYDNL